MRQRQVLFLDIDGVLHRGNSYIAGNRIVSSAPARIQLFEYLPVLCDLLDLYPQVEVVLSSDWAYRFGIEPTRNMLPESLLRNRVTEATYQGCEFDEMLWPTVTRGAQVLDYVRRHSLDQWLAVDDRRDGFDACRDRLVHCQTDVGLGDAAVVALFQSRLHERFGKPTT
ncbi:HAD domain-containing protein [Paraburkholderia sp. RL17-347-BIC-D]|uniref:HAD domain-containing protein n=1 Tax=Paraburkholderia sp. RL17-347-BIC-D TaxID=3031632 RepID=UPI0038BC98FA